MIVDSVDLDWVWDGDYVVGQDGDLGDTSRDLLKSIRTEIATVVKSDVGDWESDPTLGAGLRDFKGEANKRSTGDAIKNRVISKLVNAGIVKAEDLVVRVLPVHISQIMITIIVRATATQKNGLRPGDNIAVSMVYDTNEHDIFALPSNQVERAAR